MTAITPHSDPAPVRRLSRLLSGLVSVPRSADREIGGLSADSRRVSPGDLFLACAGATTHGADFIEDAINAGAAAVAVETPASFKDAGHRVPVIAVAGLGPMLGMIAARFYGDPSRELTVVGVTGTNGKTSCCHYLAQALTTDDAPCGVLGTLGYGAFGDLSTGTHTTPDAVTVQRELARLRGLGARYTVMEVSSHALEQGRVNDVRFHGAVFTNLSHEHLDYHGDLASYGSAKRRLFVVPGLRRAAVNCDDDFGRELAADLPDTVEVVRYGLDQDPRRGDDVRFVWGRELHMDATGLDMRIQSGWGEGRLRAELLGRFNASNLLAALATLLALEMPFEQALTRLAITRPVAGRMERLGGNGRTPTVVVDYAHTPDALSQALEALRPHCRGRLWCVFGCGGDRDPGKRPLMGAVAEAGADRVVVTDDNPRSEPGAAIIEQILAGMSSPRTAEVQADRAVAIHRAVATATPGDVVLIAGKGHEEFQIIGAERRPFSDRLEARRALEAAA